MHESTFRGETPAMRIALFTDMYVPQVSGVTLTLSRLVERARDLGHEVALVTPRVSATDAPGTSLHIQLGGIPAPIYPEILMARPLDPPGARLLDEFQPDLVHVATEFIVGCSGVRWALRRNLPLVTSFHTNFPAFLSGYGMTPLHGLVWRYLRWLHAHSDRTFCPSRTTRRELREHGFPHDVRIWSRGVDAELFNPGRRCEDVRREMAPGAEDILVCVGRMAPEKRLDVLLEAFRRIRRDAPRATELVLVGDGPMRKNIERNKPEGVRLTGYRRGEALAATYASGDAFVFPSDTETFGNVVMEAFASGLPVITVNEGGVADLVQPGVTGMLVPARDPEGLADATLEALSDPSRLRRMGRAARSFAKERTWPMVLDGLLQEYAEVVGTGIRTGGGEIFS